MSFISKLFDLIKQGFMGKNKGLPMGLPKVESLVDGVQRKTYTLLAGGTGSGKTTFALYSYIYKPMMENFEDDKFKVLYYSLEMSGEILLAKLLSLHIFETYGIELSYKQIISRQDIISEETLQLLESCVPWLEKVQQKLIIHDRMLTPRVLFASLTNFAEQHGTFSIPGEANSDYTQNDPDTTILIVIDHLGLIRRDAGQNKKEAIDLASNYLIHFRNKCGFAPLALTQLNRGSSSMDRRSAHMQEIQLDDLKDTGGPSEDAEVVVAIFNPFREKMQNYKGYNIAILRDKFRAIQVLKNRLGEADKSVSVNFHGSIGFWRELPKPDIMGRLTEAEYEPYLHLLAPEPKTEETQEKATGGGFSFRF